jgi:hypothetical protein
MAHSPINTQANTVQSDHTAQLCIQADTKRYNSIKFPFAEWCYHTDYIFTAYQYLVGWGGGEKRTKKSLL